MTQKFRTAFYVTGYLAAYSGFLLLFYSGHNADFYPNAKQLILKTHIASVVPWLFTCGMLFSIHVIPQLQSGITQGRKTGIWLVVLLIAMSISGYAIQLLPTAMGISTARLAHIVLGSGFSLLFAGHLYLIRPTLRVAVSAVTGISLLMALPFFLLKAAPDMPDEIQLKPVTLGAPGSAAQADLKKN